MPVGSHKGILHGFLGVLGIAKDGETDAEDAALVTTHEQLEGSSITRQHALDKDQVAFARWLLVRHKSSLAT